MTRQATLCFLIFLHLIRERQCGHFPLTSDIGRLLFVFFYPEKPPLNGYPLSLLLFCEV